MILRHAIVAAAGFIQDAFIKMIRKMPAQARRYYARYCQGHVDAAALTPASAMLPAMRYAGCYGYAAATLLRRYATPLWHAQPCCLR